MSRPHIIVSAVHEIGSKDSASEEDFEAFWEAVQPEVEITDTGYENKAKQHRGSFYSLQREEELPIAISYHSSEQRYVGEVDIVDDMKGVAVTGAEEILEEINNRLSPDFTLEVYYWYDGVDRPGGK
jgi:uncharacterized protein CbrC (UPF0167 family)